MEPGELGADAVAHDPPAETPQVDERATNESTFALVTLVDSSSPTPPEPPAAKTPMGGLRAQPPPDEAPPALRYLPLEQAAFAWIDHVQGGGAVPDPGTFVELMHALVAPRVPRPPVPMAALAGDTDARLILVDTEPKFPHMRETENGRLSRDDAIWTQCKTKMTHICVRLVNSKGESVRGVAVHPEGLRLRLTLHKVSDFADTGSVALDDSVNARANEGLFLGRAGNAFEPEVVLLMEGRHEFRFQVMLLSSDIGGARMFFKVAPVDPQLARNANLTVRSHSFVSRARMPDASYSENKSDARRASGATQLLGMAMAMAKTMTATEDAEAPAHDTETDSRDASPPPKRRCPSPVAHRDP